MKLIIQLPMADRKFLFRDLPDPSAGTGQLLVEVKAVSLNPVDYKVKRGIARFMSGSRFHAYMVLTCRSCKSTVTE